MREGRFVPTKSAGYTALALGFDDEDIGDCVCTLDEGDFHKSMASVKQPGRTQDVYRTRYDGQDIYLKIDISEQPDGQLVVVISFKEDRS